MRIGSLYAGIGGLDWAVEQAVGLRTAWQLDMVGVAVRRRHWPDALQVAADVSTVDPNELPGIDILSGSFACQDLSVAGLGAGLLFGSRTGPTYRHLLRFAGARLTEHGFESDDRRKWLPDLVIMENVPALLTRWQTRLEEDWGRLGYGLTWVRARALDSGHPHRRTRVFMLAERGGVGRGVLDAPRDGEWTPERGEEPLAQPVRPWPTVVARDYKTGELAHRNGGSALSADLPTGHDGSRLSPDWCCALMGFPPGWTLPTGPRLDIDPDAPAVRGRYPADWDRSQYWPGVDWEPTRTLPDGPASRGRPARIKGIGNAVCPQQGRMAIATGLFGAAQLQLWGTTP